MSKSSYIKLVNGSKQSTITLEEVKQLLEYYIEMTTKTGQQLGWQYEAYSFPYELLEQSQNDIPYLLLKGKDPLYHYLIIGVGKEEETETTYIQIVLPTEGTQGDLGKANEFAKFLAKQLKGELHLMNGRIIYYNDRK